MSAPRGGPCSPWIPGSEVAEMPWVLAAAQKLKSATPPLLTDKRLENICEEAATAASELLYELTGRIFSGECGPVTIKPVARPVDADTRGLGRFQGDGWYASWGSCIGVATGVVPHYGCSNPPEIELGAYPVTEIVEVKINGAVIPADEYTLRDFRTLVRMRPTASSVPTERHGWPTCQSNDLPDTQQGTFSVTYKYGQPPPASGKLAARKLSEYLALPQLGDTTKYPQRVTSVQRQGVSAMIVDVMDIVKTGKTGIYEVDVFLRSVNPTQNARQASVWSPDLGRPRRTADPST